MIRITIELQSVVTGETSVLGRLFVWNQGHESAKNNKPGCYNYGVAMQRRGCPEPGFACVPEDKDTVRRGHVSNYPAPAYNVWRLITRALRSALPEEK